MADDGCWVGDEAAAAGAFDYQLPSELIAQHPAEQRDGARLMVLERAAGGMPRHSSVSELPRWLRRDDLLVVNRSRVIPARLRARRDGGGAVEILLLAPVPPDGRDRAATERPCWRALVRPARRLREGRVVTLVPSQGHAVHTEPQTESIAVEIVRLTEGHAVVAFPNDSDVLAILERFGELPLPPYIRRPAGATSEDRDRYQTVFAAEPGSIAAPTAGLHLTARLLTALAEAGIDVAEIVLHVGPATFLAGRPGRAPLAVEPELYQIPAATCDQVREASGRRRVVAVGTTTTRALESAARAGWPDGTQQTSLVLAPGARFAVVGGLLTNFHLPGSSLLALVSAFAGVETVRRAYAVAVAERYRFYSYGDAMLVL